MSGWVSSSDDTGDGDRGWGGGCHHRGGWALLSDDAGGMVTGGGGCHHHWMMVGQALGWASSSDNVGDGDRGSLLLLSVATLTTLGMVAMVVAIG